MARKPDYPIKSRKQMDAIIVVFVSDEQIGEIVPGRKEYERIQRQKQKADADKLKNDEETELENKTRKRKHEENITEVKAKRSKYVDDLELALAALENDDVEKLNINQPTTLFDEDNDVSAKKMYSFENVNHGTPKSKNLKSCLKSPITPKMKLNVSFSNKENNTPKNRNQLERIEEEGTKPEQTPYSLRKRRIKDIKKIQKILENSDDEDFSASESEYSGEESSEEEGEEVEEEVSVRKPVRRRLLDEAVSSENYFESQGVKKTITSNNTLRKLKTPKLTQEHLENAFSGFQLSAEHRNKMKLLFTEQTTAFHQWDFVLRQNYNLLLYGVGSKKDVLNKFVQRVINKHPVIVINGFFPNITVKEIIDKICDVLRIDKDATDPIDRIESKIADYDVKIYLAINNIDGTMLRNRKSQIALSRLGKLPQIYVIASIDHINAPLIWDKCVLSDYNWIWFDSTTYFNYTEEIMYEGNIMLQQSGQLTLSSLRNVFNSLTKNSRGIFLVILKNQMEQKVATGISFRELYQECRKELLISSDVALRSQLKEFLDHMILKQKRTAEGEEKFVISIENTILKQFLEEQKS